MRRTPNDHDDPEDLFPDEGGPDLPLLFYLPGLGCPVDDFARAARGRLKGLRVAGIDLPGAAARAGDDFACDLPALAEMLRTFCLAARIERFLLVGHSMGGALATLVAARMPGSVAGFVNIEGNLEPADCFVSRRIAEAADAGLAELVTRTLPAELKNAGGVGNRTWAKRLARCPDPAALREMARSLVHETDSGAILAAWNGLDCPKALLRGVDSPPSAAADRLAAAGDRIEYAPGGHFPFLDRPADFFRRLGAILEPWIEGS